MYTFTKLHRLYLVGSQTYPARFSVSIWMYLQSYIATYSLFCLVYFPSLLGPFTFLLFFYSQKKERTYSAVIVDG